MFTFPIGLYGADLYPYKIPYAADLTALSSPDTLPTDATISVWFDPGSGYEHVHIYKDDTTVTVKFDNGSGNNYTGTIGSTYADLLKNVLTEYKSTYEGLYAELHCCDQLVATTYFGQYSPAAATIWVPKEVTLPTAQEEVLLPYNEGTATYSNFPERPTTIFDNDTSQRHDECARTAFSSGAQNIYCNAYKDYGSGVAYAISKLVQYGPNNYGTVYGASGTQYLYLDGSNNGVDWDNIGVVSWTGSVSNEIHTVTSTDQETEYRYVRGRFVAYVSASNRYVSCAEFRIYALQDYTYGDEGAYLDFADSGALGDDESGEQNDWTLTGSQSTNTPTN